MAPTQKLVEFGSYTVSIANVIRVFNDLSQAVEDQADIELAQWVKQPDQTEDDFSQAKNNAKARAYRVTVTVFYADGSSAFGMDEAIFQTNAQGPHISLVFMTNTTAFKTAANADPVNRFQLWFDFAQPPLMDASTIISGPTPNRSRLEINGDRQGWLAGIEASVLSHIDKRHNVRGALHGSFVYDYGLMLLGVPLSL